MMTQPREHALARATARIGEARYAVSIDVGRHHLVADEPAVLGGQDAGPPPFGLLLSALGACTSATLKMYAERKGWPLEGLEVELAYLQSGKTERIERVLRLHGMLDTDQRARLAEIAERTPVTLAIKGGVPIHTELGTASS